MQDITFQSLQASVAIPEIFLALAACLILMVGLFVSKENSDRVCYVLSLIALLATAGLIISDFSSTATLAFN